MFKIDRNVPSEAFQQAWSIAGKHIAAQSNEEVIWLRSNLNLPLSEHLSFRMGNQIFYIFVEAEEFKFDHHASLFLSATNDANAVPCIMPMGKTQEVWKPKERGWGLIHANTKKCLIPEQWVSDTPVVMSDWELHDFAIQTVSGALEKEGKKVLSKQSSMDIDPSIWFEDDKGVHHFAIVPAARYPETESTIPENTEDIKKGCAELSGSGFFASVGIVNADDPFDLNAKENGNFMPLYRGHGMFTKYGGLRVL